jgi:hypothetical protein
MEDVNRILKDYSKGITETDEYKTYVTKMCNACKKKTGVNTCDAYPDGIPDDIYNGKDWLDSLCLKGE